MYTLFTYVYIIYTYIHYLHMYTFFICISIFYQIFNRFLVPKLFPNLSRGSPEPASLTWCEKLTDDGHQVMAKAHIAIGKVS